MRCYGNINQPLEFTEDADSDAEGLIVNSAGFITQVAAAEIYLLYDKIDKNDAYVQGIMTWGILKLIFYTIGYWFIQETNNKDGDNYQGDLQGIERYSDESMANLFAIGIVAIAASQRYRFLKAQIWAPDWINGNFHDLNFMPLRSGEVRLKNDTLHILLILRLICYIHFFLDKGIIGYPRVRLVCPET